MRNAVTGVGRPGHLATVQPDEPAMLAARAAVHAVFANNARGPAALVASLHDFHELARLQARFPQANPLRFRF